jgi:G3E family GTPase
LPLDIRKQQSDDKHTTMVQEYGNILRTKGFCWLAGRDTFMIGIAQSGRIGGLVPIMPWYALIPKDQWGVEDPKDLVIEGKFAGPHGDRRQEIVFIGLDLKVDAFERLWALVFSPRRSSSTTNSTRMTGTPRFALQTNCYCSNY